MDTGKNCLLYIISPAHVISSVSALKSLHRQDERRITLLVHWPGIDGEVSEEIGAVVAKLSRNMPHIVKTVVLSLSQKEAILSKGNKQNAIATIKDLFGTSRFDEIYYAHDMEGGMFQFLCTAYAEAKRICFGDAFGNVYEKKVHLGFLKKKVSPSLSRGIATTKKALKIAFSRKKGNSELPRGLLFKEFKPDQAVLILPVDQSGNFLRRLPLVTCLKETFLEVVRECISNSEELRSYEKTLLEAYPEPGKFLLLTDNFAEGKFMAFGREIEMYCAIIRKNCAHGDVVFLKSHPLESLPRNQKIREQIGSSFKVVELESRFKRYPIELWEGLVRNCKIACMSYPVLSLKYLYGIDVLQPMTNEFIEHWFPEWTWASYKNALSLYMQPLRRLDGWDGKSVLWSGKMREK